ncbi:MAG: adenylyl-sulfate kinase [Desulfovibrionaceae bacterium]|nr:adenylyl-sulfate kinase [Desulfovibrionaceae bacterium]
MSFTIWFTGPPGSGKTTLSGAVHREIVSRGLKAELFDGDVVRKGLGNVLGFDERDRNLNVLYLGYLSQVLNRNGVISVVGAIAPYAAARKRNRELIPNYVEAYCCCPLEVLTKRDPRNYYQRALSGEISNFTGVSDRYEAPRDPELTLFTDRETAEECLARILDCLSGAGLVR